MDSTFLILRNDGVASAITVQFRVKRQCEDTADDILVTDEGDQVTLPLLSKLVAGGFDNGEKSVVLPCVSRGNSPRTVIADDSWESRH